MKMSLPFIADILKGFKERLTGYIGTIGSDHAYIHKGIAFTAVIDVGSISAAYDIAFKTPKVESGKFVHWRPIGLQTSADYVKIELREGDSFSSGTAVTPINRNRISDNVSVMQTFVKNATATPAGTLIGIGGIGTLGNAASRSGGGAGADEEIVLKQNTNYILTITPAGATSVTAELFWYEEDMGS
jgi:hypothetical protein